MHLHLNDNLQKNVVSLVFSTTLSQHCTPVIVPVVSSGKVVMIDEL
jgi:thymidylate kinase